MNFERQLAAIKDKAELHLWIDGLPDDVELKGIVIVTWDTPDAATAATARYREIGAIDLKETNWIIDHFKAWMVGVGDE